MALYDIIEEVLGSSNGNNLIKLGLETCSTAGNLIYQYGPVILIGGVTLGVTAGAMYYAHHHPEISPFYQMYFDYTEEVQDHPGPQ
jgi:hypothetical protein